MKLFKRQPKMLVLKPGDILVVNGKPYKEVEGVMREMAVQRPQYRKE